jgi:prevent-host-death family protein
MYKTYYLYYIRFSFSAFQLFSFSAFQLFRIGPRMASTISTSKAREFLADLITEVAYKGERVILTRHGKAVAALISAEDLERLEALDSTTG